MVPALIVRLVPTRTRITYALLLRGSETKRCEETPFDWAELSSIGMGRL